MPSTLETDDTVALSLYDVVASEGLTSRFINHTGLSKHYGEHDRNTVHVADMGPPLRPGFPMKAYAVGRAYLDESEYRKVKDFIDRHEEEHKATMLVRLTHNVVPQMYCILPHAVRYPQGDEAYVRMRFSCAGFVFEAYKRAGIQLVDLERIPTITLQQIKRAYPNYADLLDYKRFRESMGLNGDGPWPVLLCGYLIHSLDRDTNSIRREHYITQLGDEFFPKHN